tara:strand:+ start:130 stop:351 length:222 start_codon:yes stop_codon:yes gene_type:complete
LLTQNNSETIKFLSDLEKQSKNMKLELMKICWHMRGGLTWQEALNLPPQEREIITQLIKENYETTKKTGQPFF